jgi:zinc protease
MNIALTGQLSVKQAQKLAERISSLPQGEAAKPLAVPQDKPNFDIQHIVFNSTQAHVTMGHLSTTRDDPDRLARTG